MDYTYIISIISFYIIIHIVCIDDKYYIRWNDLIHTFKLMIVVLSFNPSIHRISGASQVGGA